LIDVYIIRGRAYYFFNFSIIFWNLVGKNALKDPYIIDRQTVTLTHAEFLDLRPFIGP
jgi:hypothetical protein